MAKTNTPEAMYARNLDYKRTFNTPEGKRVLYDLMVQHYVLKPTIQGKTGPITMAHREGQRAVIARIISQLKTNPEMFLKMIEEGEHE